MRLFIVFCSLLSAAAALGQDKVENDPLAGLPPEIVALLRPPTWTETITLHSGVGYKDNILFSSFQPYASGFARGGLEAFLWHTPVGRADYFVLLNAEGTRYFSANLVDHEAQAILLGEWRYRIEDKFKFTVDTQSYYLDQIFDLSDTDAQRTVARLQVIGASLGPALHWEFVPKWWLESRALGKRESYHDGSNNNRIAEGEFRTGCTPATRFESSIGVIGRQRAFDHREQFTEGGRAITGTFLRITEFETQLKIKATLDRAGHWKSTLRTGTLHYTDNGSGYFNYREKKIAADLEWNSGDWLVHLEGSAKRLVYEVQTVGLGINPDARLKEAYEAQLRLERKLNERWTIYSEYNWERNRTNYVIADYAVNEGLLGVQWSWEK